MEQPITLQQLTCIQCGWRWFPRVLTKPRRCPACQTRHWERPAPTPAA